MVTGSHQAWRSKIIPRTVEACRHIRPPILSLSSALRTQTQNSCGVHHIGGMEHGDTFSPLLFPQLSLHELLQEILASP